MALKIRFWGTRGSVATPGLDTVKYGGNTSCVEMSDENNLVIFDAGTGIRLLGQELARRHGKKAIEGHIFISHFHLDHIQGFPFFIPIYEKGNNFTIYGCKAGGKNLEGIFMGQMSPEYFPVALKEIPATLHFREITTKPVAVNGWKVYPMYVNHPGLALGYRLETDKHKAVYMTDNEPFRYLMRQQDHQKMIFDDWERNQVEICKEDRSVVEFVRGADVLIHDAQYTMEEYKSKLSWGHSFQEFALEVAMQAEVKQLVLFHHDPLRSDKNLDKILKECQKKVDRRRSRLVLKVASEGLEIRL